MLTGIAVDVISLQDVFTFLKICERTTASAMSDCLTVPLLSADIHTCSHTFLLKSLKIEIKVAVHVPENGT